MGDLLKWEKGAFSGFKPFQDSKTIMRIFMD